MDNLANVIEIKRDNDNGYKAIKMFLAEKEDGSNKTSTYYRQDIAQFFNSVFGIDSIEQITDDMIKELNNDNIKKYYQKLKKNRSSNTVSRSVTSLRGLFNYFINMHICDSEGSPLMICNVLKEYKVRVKVNSYGAYSRDEVYAIVEEAMKDNEEMALYFAMLVQTGERASEVIDLTLKDIKQIDGKYYITGIGKHHRKFKTQIEKILYDMCVKLSDRDKVIFHFSVNQARIKLYYKSTLDSRGNVKTNFNNTYCARIGLTEEEVIERNLTLHSFKKTLGTVSAENGACLSEIVKILHHSNVNSAQYYINKATNSDCVNENTKYMSFENKDKISDDIKNKLDGLTKEELIEAIMNSSASTRLDVINHIQ